MSPAPALPARAGRPGPWRRGRPARRALLLGAGLALGLAATGLRGAPGSNPAAAPGLPAAIPSGSLAPIPEGAAGFPLASLVVVVPAVAWAAAAARHAARRDAAAVRRARRGLRVLHARWSRPGPGPTRAEVEHWRALTIAAWGFSRRVLTPDEFAARLAPVASRDNWRRAWEEAERALYSRRFELPADWWARAEVLTRELPVPPAAPWLPRRRDDWWPREAVATLGLALVAGAWVAGPALRAGDPLGGSVPGRFAAAKAQWLAAVAAAPNDWAARHDLALLAAREEKWNEAVGHATAAFLLHPADAAVAGSLRLALARAEAGDPGLQNLVSDGGWPLLVRQLSAAQWQQWRARGVVAVSLGATLLVLALYRPGPRRAWRVVGLGCALGGAGIWILANAALGAYGPGADPRAVVVIRSAELRPFPSDLTPKKQTAALPVGTLARVQRTFLGWDQIAVGPDLAGWVRAGSVTWIYRHRDDAVPVRLEHP